MRSILIGLMLVFAVALMAFAVTSEKPASHDTSWIKRHGNASKLNIDECTACHVEKVSCTKCHQEVAPRTHTPGLDQEGTRT